MRHLISRKYALLTAMVCFATPVFSAGADPADSSKVVLVETKHATISGQELETEVSRIPAQHRAEVLASRKRLSKLLESMLVNKTLATQARSAGLEKEPEMSRQIQNAVDKLLAKEQITRLVQKIDVPDMSKVAREQYQLEIEKKYTLPTTVHASHILVDTKSRTPEEALQRIKQARDLAVAGKKFEDLALEYSDDPSAKNNKGDLGFFDEKRMIKEFADAAFAMNTAGEISEPVKTTFGYHIIQFHEKKPSRVIPFEEVRERLIEAEREKYRTEYRRKYIADVLLDPSLQLNEEAIDRYLTSKPTVPAGKGSPSENNEPEAAKQ